MAEVNWKANRDSVLIDDGEGMVVECFCGSHERANLVAASPALYEALKEAEIAIEAAPDNMTTKIAKRKIRAALALAEGKKE